MLHNLGNKLHDSHINNHVSIQKKVSVLITTYQEHVKKINPEMQDLFLLKFNDHIIYHGVPLHRDDDGGNRGGDDLRVLRARDKSRRLSS